MRRSQRNRARETRPRLLGINRNTLRKKRTEHGIDPDGLEA